MDTASSTYSTRRCSKCPGDTEYHCVSCPCDLCPQCKENHVKDLQTIDHDVVSHRDKINYIPTQEICMKEMSRHIVSLQEYELRYVQPEFTFSALQFLSSIKTALPHIHLTLHTSQLSMTESLNKEDVMESLKRTDSTWGPWCVYWSPSTGDLLVGMYNDDTGTGKVTRYNQSGQLTQTIQNHNTGLRLYSYPINITENNNGDVVVSDWSGAVVVTESGGRHRFSYTGHPSGSKLWPQGICTDPLSHILVCDYTTNTVQMLDSDGQFLSHLLIRPSGIFSPRSLSYDVNTHRLWVGSRHNNTVVIYRYITRQDALTDLNPATADVMESLSEIPTPGTEKPQQGNQCLLKLMSSPKLLPSLTLTGVDRCYHISCVTSDRVWVSDDRNNLMLTDTTGVPLHRVGDSPRDLYGGLHTVNNEHPPGPAVDAMSSSTPAV
eukprot:XP_011430158.2 PREDICTED: uncharacterized protein LOC105330250 [Crassostrea gigas]